MGFNVKKGSKGREAQNLTDNSSGNAIWSRSRSHGAQKVKYLLRFLLINRRGEKIVLNIFTPSRAPALLFILCIYVRKPKIEHQCVKKMFIYRNRKWIVKANHSWNLLLFKKCRRKMNLRRTKSTSIWIKILIKNKKRILMN